MRIEVLLRMRLEKEELVARLVKAKEFLKSMYCPMLHMQVQHMDGYLRVLEYRIEKEEVA